MLSSGGDDGDVEPEPAAPAAVALPPAPAVHAAPVVLAMPAMPAQGGSDEGGETSVVAGERAGLLAGIASFNKKGMKKAKKQKAKATPELRR